MRKIAGAIGLGAALTMSCLVAAGSTANAEPAKPRSLYAPSALVLTIGSGDDAKTATVQRAVTLNCRPKAGGTHPDASGACAALYGVDGRFAELPTPESDGRACTKDYRPIVVTAQGVWDGRRVDYSRTYGNACTMESLRSVVFSF
ncbi:subtilase-type protease inhibitor [Streptomyces sp. XD-27]|uniref:subtilase-type protease inhibitor n=1 Tax=Streptomyces sp. XD-27 TaxID=3062779 RepID=UPI0026F46BDC|nr:subtilase-type protease inhibitor [Streptomyces sp. XD-27]WKX69592.1 subtilase-type protease inhibitor [Streptomyces sp. XD-27]